MLDCTVNEVKEILLVGGSTKIPLIQELLERKFGKAPRKDINPEEAIALGAALEGWRKSVELYNNTELTIINVSPYSIGIGVAKIIGNRPVNGYYEPIITKGSILPITKKVTFSTDYDNQDEIKVSVYRGEKLFINDNVLLGEVGITGIPRRPAGKEKVEVTFSLDENGIFYCKGKLLRTGKICLPSLKDNYFFQHHLMDKSNKDYWGKYKYYGEVKHGIKRAYIIMKESDQKTKRKIEILLDKLEMELINNNLSNIKRVGEELTDFLMELI